MVILVGRVDKVFMGFQRVKCKRRHVDHCHLHFDVGLYQRARIIFLIFFPARNYLDIPNWDIRGCLDISRVCGGPLDPSCCLSRIGVVLGPNRVSVPIYETAGARLHVVVVKLKIQDYTELMTD